MNTVMIKSSKLSGSITIPPSKSISHRAIISAALANGASEINNLMMSHDIEATLEGMKAFGAEIKKISDSSLRIRGMHHDPLKSSEISCRESGSTLRFLIPLAAAFPQSSMIFTGTKRLGERPLTPYYELFDRQNLLYQTTNGKLPLEIKGGLKSDKFFLPGNISSQFITGLLFALPLLNGDSSLHITSPLESKGYIDLTLDILKHFGIQITHIDYKDFFIQGNQTYVSNDYQIEGDFSQGAFWIVAGLIGNELSIKGLNTHSLQGDKVILDIVAKMGGNLSIDSSSILVTPSKTKGIVIDASQCPDLVPILAVLGSVSEGTTEIVNASRLRIKESDRLASTTKELNKLGAEIIEKADSLIITGKKQLKGGIVDSWNDHRIAMAMAIASIKCSEPVTITGSESVKKSYPSFWKDFIKLGGELDELHVGK